MPPCETGLPDILRATVTTQVSKIGIIKIRTGVSRTAQRLRVLDISPRSAIPPRENPRNIDPQSPIKIEAGLKFNHKNPAIAPASKSGREASAPDFNCTVNPAFL